MLQRQPGSQKSPVTEAIRMLALIAAVVLTFFATPLLYGQTIDWVKDYTATHYGYGLESVVPFFWGIAVVLITFFVSTAIITTAVLMGTFWLIRR